MFSYYFYDKNCVFMTIDTYECLFLDESREMWLDYQSHARNVTKTTVSCNIYKYTVSFVITD